MIKDRLMKALKAAAEDYNGGMAANAAIAKAASAEDFNEKQAERLVEMFNTLAAINKERDRDDPAGTCELADKAAVSRLLLDGCGPVKAASCAPDYSFYLSTPERTNPSIEAMASGREALVKAAFAPGEDVPDALDVSRRSLYLSIMDRIGLVKAAGAAADDVARSLRAQAGRDAAAIAMELEDPLDDGRMADMFKAAADPAVVEEVSRYSTRLAGSDGGGFAGMEVFDSSPVDGALKMAEGLGECLRLIPEYEAKRDMYLSKAAGAMDEMKEALGLKTREDPPKAALSDMLVPAAGPRSPLEKSAGPLWTVPVPNLTAAHDILTKAPKMDDEKERTLNAERGILLADLMNNDPIIRDADPSVVAEAYKTMVVTSPRLAQNKALVTAFLRSAVNSVAISPNDAKTLTDVDKGTALANMPPMGDKTDVFKA